MYSKDGKYGIYVRTPPEGGGGVIPPPVVNPRSAWVLFAGSVAGPDGETTNYLPFTSINSGGLVDTTNQLLPWTFSGTVPLTGASVGAPSGDDSGVLPDIFYNPVLFGSTLCEWLVAGLTPNGVYRVRITGSRAKFTSRRQRVTVAGITQDFQAAMGDLSRISVEGFDSIVSADGTGTITMSVVPLDTYIYLGGFIIEEVVGT